MALDGVHYLNPRFMTLGSSISTLRCGRTPCLSLGWTMEESGCGESEAFEPTSCNWDFHPVIQYHIKDCQSVIHSVHPVLQLPPVFKAPFPLPHPPVARNAKRLHGLRRHRDEEAGAVDDLGRRTGGHVGPEVIRLGEEKNWPEKLSRTQKMDHGDVTIYYMIYSIYR